MIFAAKFMLGSINVSYTSNMQAKLWQGQKFGKHQVNKDLMKMVNEWQFNYDSNNLGGAESLGELMVFLDGKRTLWGDEYPVKAFTDLALTEEREKMLKIMKVCT